MTFPINTMLNQLLRQKYNYSQKYQRELALSIVFQYLLFGRFFLPIFLSKYFIEILNEIIFNYYRYNETVWEGLYRSNFFVMNYMERALLLLLFAEMRKKNIEPKLLTYIYIRLAKKYCRKNFYKLIPVFVSNVEKSI